MDINILFTENINEYKPSSKPTLFITSERAVAVFLTLRNEAVCIQIKNEEDLSLFKEYHYFITSDVPPVGHLEKIYCHIKNIPYVIGENEEFLIREECPEDMDIIYSMYEDEECLRFLEPLPDYSSVDKESRFESVKNGYLIYEYGMWIIESKENHEVIGRVGFEYKDENTVSLGFMIKSGQRKKGYAYKACLLCIKYLNEILPEMKITAECDASNIASLNLISKLNL